MPIYEYHCPKCGTFETMQRITEPSLKRCPTCKSKVERMMSRTSFVLKGSGWYATDYARAGAKPPDDSSEKSGEKPSGASAGIDGKKKRRRGKLAETRLLPPSKVKNEIVYQFERRDFHLNVEEFLHVAEIVVEPHCGHGDEQA